MLLLLFFFNDTATTEIYTLSLHDALPIWPTRAPEGGPRGPLRRPPPGRRRAADPSCAAAPARAVHRGSHREDRKSTRLNSSHMSISYAVFCLKKKKRTKGRNHTLS